MVLRVIFAFVGDESGATAIEYALLGTLIGMGIIVAFGTFANGITAIFGSTQTGAGAQIEDAVGKV